MADRPTSAPARDRGFTLVETLIAVIVIGVIVAAVATAITVVLRNAPPSEVRADDARSMQGLVTWLPQDIDAAPPEGFNRDESYWPCAGSAPVNSYNIVTAEWEERGVTTVNFAATYRYEEDDGAWSIRRYACDDETTSGMGEPRLINLTAELPPWDPSSPPASIAMCRTTVTVGGTCPTDEIVPDGIDQPNEGNGGGVLSMQLSVVRADGAEITIDAAPKNPDQDLADDPYASVNQAPEVDNLNATVQMYAGETVTFDLATTHNPVDPDGDPISVALDSTEPVPTGLTVTTSDPFDVEITADPSIADGTMSSSIVLIISDNRAGWVDALLTVEIVPAPNLPPTADTTSYELEIVSGEDATLALDATHGISDPEGDELVVDVVSYPNSWTNPPKADEPGPLDLLVKTPPSNPLGPAAEPIVLEVSDGVNAPITITVDIVFIDAPNQAPTATTTHIALDMYADETITVSLDATHGVSDPDGDALSITEIDAQPDELDVSLDGGLVMTLTTDAGLAEGTLSPWLDVDVRDPLGERIDIRITVTIIPTPEPPSYCELLTLTVSPDPVDRHASGPRPHLLAEDVTVTLTYDGACDGLHLNYESGDTSGLGVGTGRVFPPGSPTSIVIVSKDNGGTEKWSPETHTLTASTTSSDAIVGMATATLSVNR